MEMCCQRLPREATKQIPIERLCRFYLPGHVDLGPPKVPCMSDPKMWPLPPWRKNIFGRLAVAPCIARNAGRGGRSNVIPRLPRRTTLLRHEHGSPRRLEHVARRKPCFFLILLEPPPVPALLRVSPLPSAFPDPHRFASGSAADGGLPPFCCSRSCFGSEPPVCNRIFPGYLPEFFPISPTPASSQACRNPHTAPLPM